MAPVAGGIAVAVDTRDHGAVGPRIAKFTAAGTAMTAFGGDGVADAPVPPSSFLETWWTVAIAVDVAGGVFTLMAEDTFSSGGRLVSRLRPDGTPDAAFGSGGVVELPRALFGEGLAALPDGGVAVVGDEGAQPLVMRLTSTGAPAPGFGVDGVARPRPGVNALADAVISDGSDGLLVGGRIERAGDHYRPATYRLTATGELDPAYGDHGASALPDGWEIASLARAPDGSVFALEGHFTGDCALYHLSAAGGRDPDYRASVGYPRPMGALAVDSAGRAVVSGDSDTGVTAIRRFTAAGEPDQTFGDAGAVTPPETMFELGAVTSGTTVVFAATTPFPREPADPVVGDTTIGAITGGRPDPAVGPGGVRVTQLGTTNAGVVGAPVLRPDGGVTVLGGYRSGNHYAAPATFRLAADGRGPVEEPRTVPSLGRFGVFLDPVPLADGTTILLGTDDSADASATTVVLGRLGADGHADPAFGTGGLVRTAIARPGGSGLEPQGTAVGTGFVVAFGTANDWTIARFAADGSPEPGFGSGGRRDQTAGFPVATTTDAAGRLLVGVLATSSQPGVAVRRLLASGDPDPAFAEDGTLELPGFSSDPLAGVRLLARPDGGVLVVGIDGGSAKGLRLTPVDAAGIAGPASIVPIDSFTPPNVRAAALDDRGRVLVAGTYGPYGYPFLLRLRGGLATYAPDDGFGANGAAFLQISELMTFGGMAVRPDGRILITGTVTPGDPRWSVSQTLGDPAPTGEDPPTPQPPLPPPPPIPPQAAGVPGGIAPTPTPATSTARPGTPAAGAVAAARLTAPSRVRRAALARGLRVTVRCPTRCRGRLTATLDAATARLLRIRHRRLATVTVPATRGSRIVTARLATDAVRRLRGLRRTATITLRLNVAHGARPIARTVRITP